MAKLKSPLGCTCAKRVGIIIFLLETRGTLSYSKRHLVTWAVNSAGECYLHTVEVAGSIPAPPTMKIKGLAIDR
jgi:hypothetical protein